MIEATRIQAVYRGYASRRLTKMAIQQFEHDCLEIQQEIEYDSPSYHYQPNIGLAPYLGMDFNGDVLVFSVNQQCDLEYYKSKAAHTRASKTVEATHQHQVINTHVLESTGSATADSNGIPTVLEKPTAEILKPKITVASTTVAESAAVVSNASELLTATIDKQQPKVSEIVATERASIIEATNVSAEQTAILAVTAVAAASSSTAGLQTIVTTFADAISTGATVSKVSELPSMIEEVDNRDGARGENGALTDVMCVIDEMVLDVIAAAEAATKVTSIATISTAMTTIPLPQLDDDVSKNPNIISILKEANSSNEQQQITPILPSTSSISPLETKYSNVHGDSKGDTKGDDEASANRQDEIKMKKMDALKTESLWLEKSLRERIQILQLIKAKQGD